MDLTNLFSRRNPASPTPPAPAPAPPAPRADGGEVLDWMIPHPPLEEWVAWDTETHLITEEEPLPPLVCVQTQVGRSSGLEDAVVWGADPESKEQGVDFIFWILESTKLPLIALNGFYDYAVLLKHRKWDPRLVRLVFDAFQSGRLRDCVTRAELAAVEFDWLDHDPDIGGPPKFSMEQLAKKYLGESVEGKHGPDSYRLRYAELDGIPAKDWPPGAYNYAALDPEYAARIYLAICKYSTASPDEAFQTLKEWSLYLAGAWGISVDPDRVEALEKRILPTIRAAVEELSKPRKGPNGEDLPSPYVAEQYKINLERVAEEVHSILGDATVRTPAGDVSLASKQLAKAFAASGFPLLDPSLSKQARLEKALSLVEDPQENPWVTVVPAKRDMKTITVMVEEHFREAGRDIPLTTPKPNKKTGITPEPRTSTAREVIEQVPALMALAEIGAVQKVDSMYLSHQKGKVPIFKRNIAHARWYGLKATGRVSVSNPNLNNLPRMAGIRECFRARPGYVMISADYAQAELCSLAQVCIDKFGHSRMGELINSGIDLHLHLVSKLRDRTYEWLVANKKDPQVKRDRQGGKAVNFGKPGGLGITKFIEYASTTFGIDMTVEEAEEWIAVWMAEYPEMNAYFRWISTRCRNSATGKFPIVQHRTGRRRGRVGYTDGLNTLFQGLTADGAAHAINLITREAWLDETSPIYGFRLIAFIYDEVLGEFPDRGPEANTAAANRICQIMQEAMEVFTPDVVAKVETALQYNWCKAADPVWDTEPPSPLLYPHEHRGGRVLTLRNGSLQIEEHKIFRDRTVLGRWDEIEQGKLVRWEDVPQDVREILENKNG